MAQATGWRAAYRVPNTLLSDTEESVVGTSWHQDATSFLADMVREVARRRTATWGVCNQIALLGLQHENGTAYDPRPDVMVLARPLRSGRMSSITLAEAGVPHFVAEVASRSTVGHDRGDKRHAYEAIGVPAYVVFDPDGDLLPDVLRGWRLEGGVYAPWRAEADGWWHSASLELALEATQPFLGVRDRDGQRIALPSAVRAHAERLERERAEEARLRIVAEQARLDMEERLTVAEQARLEAEQARLEAEQARAEEARQRAELEEQLRRLHARDDGLG